MIRLVRVVGASHFFRLHSNNTKSRQSRGNQLPFTPAFKVTLTRGSRWIWPTIQIGTFTIFVHFSNVQRFSSCRSNLCQCYGQLLSCTTWSNYWWNWEWPDVFYTFAIDLIWFDHSTFLIEHYLFLLLPSFLFIHWINFDSLGNDSHPIKWWSG